MPTPNEPARIVHRVEVRARPGAPDARSQAVASVLREAGCALARATAAKVYLIDAPLSESDLRRIAQRLLASPVTEHATIGPAPAARAADDAHDAATIEVHPLPGVMDPAAQSVREAIADLTGLYAAVSTGWRYDVAGATPDDARDAVRRTLANPVVHQITRGPWSPARLPAGQAYRFALRHVALRALADDALARLAREAHLFLNLDEMRAIRAEFDRLARDPTDIELETIAQT